ncbi:MAG: replicative helicase, partial [Micromonosporaceae bacterium]|nr:replicative helicase [Micromonosporaceae bacterium]
VADAEHQWVTTTRASRRQAAQARGRLRWTTEQLHRVRDAHAAAGEEPRRLTTMAEVLAEVGEEFRHVLHSLGIPPCGRVVRRALRAGKPFAGSVPAYPRRALLESLIRRVEQPMGPNTKAAHPKTVTTKQIAATVRHPTNGRPNHAVVNAKPLVLPHRADLALPPYTFGVWLGNGASAATRFTTADPEMVAYVEADGFVVRPSGGPTGYAFSMEPLPELPAQVCVVCGKRFLPRAAEVRTCGRVCGGRSGAVPNQMAPVLCADCGGPVAGRGSAARRCATCHARSAAGALRALGVLDNKHIPPAYLRASEQQRRQLLAGLLDTDGTVGADGNVQFAVTSRRLAHDVHELVVSLGYRCTVKAKPVQGSPLSCTAYTLNFTTTDDDFRLVRKRLVHKERRRGTTPAQTGVRYIVDVRPVPSVPVRCVTVDNADHLYLAGRTMTPTHNSTVSMDFARNAAVRHNMASAIFSLEMSKIEIVTRLLSAEARVPLHVLRSGQLSDDDWTRLARRMGEISEAPIFVDDTPNMTLMEIRAKARRMRQRNDLKLVVVDYLQLMSSPKRTESRQQEVAELSRGLKLLAKEIECPVIAVSQLNRGPEQRTDKRPQLSDLRESGSIEQDADVVILLHRDDYYDKESPRAGEADFIVAKHRNGPTDTVTVAAQLHFSRFVDMAIS